MNIISFLPNDVLEIIFFKTDYKTICKSICISKSFKIIMSELREKYSKKHYIDVHNYISQSIKTNNYTILKDILSYEDTKIRRQNIIQCAILCIHYGNENLLSKMILSFQSIIHSNIYWIIGMNTFYIKDSIVQLLLSVIDNDNDVIKFLESHQTRYYKEKKQIQIHSG